MPFSSSGVFNPLITFVDNTPATAEDQNSQDADLAGGLTGCMTRSGLAPATAPISMGGFMINNLGVGVAPTDAVNLSQITGGYAPLAGATFTGAVHFNTTISVTGAVTFGAAAFSGATTVPTVAASDNSTNAASTANVTAKIAAQAAKTPQVTVLTTGSGTYTTPAGATYLEITDMQGAGSGGGGSGTGSPGVGTAGGPTTFGSLTAGGGPATPANTSTTLPTPATASGGDTNIQGGIGASAGAVTGTTVNNPGSGASSPLGQGGTPTSVSGSGTISASPATGFGSGGGAGGFGAGGSYNTGWGGNSGSYLKAIITSPAATYAYSVGAAGAGGVAGTSGATAGAGAGGLIRVVAHFQ